jgi:hypothetical protein
MAERLDLLRELDTTHCWESLDDERVCLLCERQFAGRHVDFVQNGSSRPHIHCPTEDCKGSPREWVHLHDPRIAARNGKAPTSFFGLPATA